MHQTDSKQGEAFGHISHCAHKSYMHKHKQTNKQTQTYMNGVNEGNKLRSFELNAKIRTLISL